MNLPFGWHPFDEVNACPLYGYPSKQGWNLYRRDGNSLVLVASCPTLEALAAANSLLSGAAYYPLWRSQQDW